MTRARKARHTKGGRNLMILGVISIVLSLMTTGVALMIYHNSGDIYLDRSRPGYLPDEDEVQSEEEVEEEYNFGNVEKVDASAVEEYLKNISEEAKDVEPYIKAFGDEALSNEKLTQKVNAKEE